MVLEVRHRARPLVGGLHPSPRRRDTFAGSCVIHFPFEIQTIQGVL